MAILEQEDVTMVQANEASPESRWAIVERVASSKNFARADRARAFLFYVARCALENRVEEITEQQIGVHVFKRSPGYDSAEDTIVRTTARLVRQRLALYYQEEGASDSLRIQIPRGGYVPLFQQYRPEPQASELPALSVPEIASPSESAAEESDVPFETPINNRSFRGWHLAAALFAGILLTLLIQKAWNIGYLHSSPIYSFWSKFLSEDQKTLFVTGDAGLNMYNNQMRSARELDLADYVSGSYLYSPAARSSDFQGDIIASRRYISIIDLELANHLMQLSRFPRKQLEIRFPRDLTSADFRNANIILAGAPVYNPWVELFDKNLSFHLVYDGQHNTMYVSNRKPLAGEPSRYEIPDSGIAEKGFGYIALTDNLEGNGKVLLIEGTTSMGVDAAASFLFDDAKIVPILARIKSNRSTLPNFEILLKATFLKSHSAETEVLSIRSYPRL